MNISSFIIVIALVGQVSERNSFDMIGVSPVIPNRFNDKQLREKVTKKITVFSSLYNGNDDLVKTALVKRKIINWIYDLPEIKGGLTEEELEDLDSIISRNIKVNKVKSKPKPKEWFWAQYGSYNILLYGWKDENGMYNFYFREQTAEAQTFLKSQGYK